MEEVYIDANIFIYGFLDSGKQGKTARTFLSKVSHGNIQGHTATLTFDEVSWKLLKQLEKKKAIAAMEAFLAFPHLNFIDVDTNVIRAAAEIMKNSSLSPRDAIHLAACKRNHLTTIISEDKDFDKIKNIQRKGLKTL